MWRHLVSGGGVELTQSDLSVCMLTAQESRGRAEVCGYLNIKEETPAPTSVNLPQYPWSDTGPWGRAERQGAGTKHGGVLCTVGIFVPCSFKE